MIVDLNDENYTYDKFITDSNKLADQYNNLIQNVTIGSSHDNRDILLLKLGLGDRKIICLGGVHGRESINTIVLMKIIEYYAMLYNRYIEEKGNLFQQINERHSDFENEYENMILGNCMHELLETYTILFIPLLNPDGYMISLYGYEIIRDEKLREKAISKKLPHAFWKYNARGVDINRNFPSKLWKPKNPNDYAPSENETKALISLFHQYDTKGFIDFHSRGKEIFYHRKVLSDTYNEKQKYIAHKLKEVTGYTIVSPEHEIDVGDSGGNTVHYYSEHFFKPAITIETVEEEASFPLDVKYRQSTYDELKLLIFKYCSII